MLGVEITVKRAFFLGSRVKLASNNSCRVRETLFYSRLDDARYMCVCV